VRFLIDNSLSPRVAERLRKAGHDAVHVRDYALQAAEDEAILARAAQEARIVVAADADFATLLVLSGGAAPSAILIRGRRYRRPEQQAKLLMDNLADLSAPLSEGCIATLGGTRARYRLLAKVAD
jgi:predicted nuclease of predicted toxin-antitoxin system